MTDNVFDRLRDLFESSGPVNWRLAREIAESVAGEAEPIEPWVAEEYEELTMTAMLRIAAASPLDPSAAPGRILIVDRRGWAAEMAEGYAYLAEPLAGRMGADPTTGGPMGQMMAGLGPAMVGMQMGSMVGSMSQRALARFDAGL
ncbi:zinc-dependent metalloprotease, partial [bacterium]|nr:zinc-dependent metalloprotease [bacterium]